MIRSTRSLQRVAVLTVLFFSALAMQSAALAQPRMPSPRERASNLKDRLGLTDSQTTAITKIFEESQLDLRRALDSARGDRESMRTVRMNMMKHTDERIDSLLTSDQKKQYEDLRKERRGRPSGRSRNG